MDRTRTLQAEDQPTSSEFEPANLLEAVRPELNGSSYAELGNIECQLEAGQLILRGTVSSFHLKQHALHAALRAPGSPLLDNRIEVVSPRPRSVTRC